jgi:hypothetical protein
MLIELSLNSFCSHGPVGRSHTAEQRARSDGPQARGYSACALRAIENSLAPEDRQQQAQENAQDDAGYDGKIKRRMFTLDPNVAGQPSQPLRRKSAPHHQSQQRDDHANDGNEFAQVAHYPKSCANRAKAQA